MTGFTRRFPNSSTMDQIQEVHTCIMVAQNMVRGINHPSATSPIPRTKSLSYGSKGAHVFWPKCLISTREVHIVIVVWSVVTPCPLFSNDNHYSTIVGYNMETFSFKCFSLKCVSIIMSMIIILLLVPYGAIIVMLRIRMQNGRDIGKHPKNKS